MPKYEVTIQGGFGGSHTEVVECDEKDKPEGAVPIPDKPKPKKDE